MVKRLLTSVSRATLGVTGLCLAALMPINAHAGNLQTDNLRSDNKIQTGTLSVDINKTQVMQLSSPAGAIVVGNPAIADISVHSPMLLFIVGRGYGTTNVIILDEFGNVISNNDIQVGFSKSASSKRILMAGKGWESYDCTPFCQPAPVLGDRPQYRVEHGGEEKLIDNTNSPIANTSFSGQSTSGGTRSAIVPGTFPAFPDTGFDPAQLQQMPTSFPATVRPSDGDF